MRKILSVLLCSLLLVSVMPLSTFATTSTSGSCGEGLSWSFEESTGVLSINGTGAMNDYGTGNKSPWYDIRQTVKEIAIGNGVTSIGNDTFSDCTNATKVTLSETVKTIGDEAFTYCTKLPEITIPADVTSIGYNAFNNCPALKTVNNYSKLPIVKGELVSGQIGYYAETVNWLYTGTIGGECGENLVWDFNKDTGKLTISGSGEMTSVPWNDMGYYPLITDISLPDGLTKIANNAFKNCKKLTEIVIPESVTMIGYRAFYQCELLEKVNIPSGVTYINSEVFYNCAKISEITIPNGVYDIGPSAFYGCTSLNTINNYSSLPLSPNGFPYGYVTFYADTVNNIAAPTLSSKTDTSVTLVAVNSYEYSKDGAIWQDSNVFEGLVSGANYSFYQRLKADTNKNIFSKTLSVSMGTERPTTPLAPEISDVTDTTVTLNPVSGCEYSKDGVIWQDSNLFEGLIPDTQYTFYQRIKATQTALASEMSEGTVVVTENTFVTGWILIDYTWYYVNEDGSYQTGWLYLDDNWYYFNEYGALETENINYCGLFEAKIDWLRLFAYGEDVSYGESFSLSTIVMLCEYEFKYRDEYYVEGTETVAIPADMIEGFAKDNFAIVDIDAMRTYKTFIYNGQEWEEIQSYDADRNVYIFSAAGGWGDSTSYVVWGYSENQGEYTVYSHLVEFDIEGMDPITGVEGEDYITLDGVRYPVISMLKTIVETDDNNVKFHSWERVDSVPARNLLTTPDGSYQTGWNLIDNIWYYVKDDGSYETGWLNLNNIWYYFNESGEMQTGWQLINYHWYYFREGGNMATGWLYVNNTYYYLTVSGAMMTGWLNLGGTWYYLTDSGAMATGWCFVGNSWYHFAESGAMMTGWQYIGGYWYYFHNGGNMATGWLLLGDTWYYFHDGGNMATGWLLLGNTWYYFHNGGNMATGWQWLGNAWYNFASSGAWLP